MIHRSQKKPEIQGSNPLANLPTLVGPVGTREDIDAALRVVDRYATDDDERAEFAVMLGIGGAR